MEYNGLPEKQGLYDPQFEHDACGIGFIANIKGKTSHGIINQAIQILKNLAHRGGVGSEPDTGDGAGILIQMPHAFMKKVCKNEGIKLPKKGDYGVGMLFLSPDKDTREESLERLTKIIDGEKQTGVTTMMMDIGLDTGDMIEKAVVDITEDDTAGSLHDKLMEAGCSLILSTMEKLENHTAVLIPQNDSESCYAKMLKKELGNIDFNRPAEEIERLIRGLNPWPSAYTRYHGKTLKIWKARVKEGNTSCKPGEITEVAKDTFCIQTGKHLLEVEELQLEGKKRMETKAFLSGVKLKAGEKLGTDSQDLSGK